MIDLASRPLPRKALSLRQPWCEAILELGKDIENRRWWTGYRGDFLLHASKGMSRDEWEDAFYFCLDRVEAERVQRALAHSWPLAKRTLYFGGIVGIARLEGIICPEDVHASRTTPLCDGLEKWHMHEQWGFRLSHVERLPFVPCKGHLSFFDVPDETLTELTSAVERAAAPLEAAHG